MPPNGGSVPPSSPGGKRGEALEVIFEFVPVGGSVKVTATDTATGTDVTIVGPAGAPHRELERIAVQKLRQRLMREGEGGVAPAKSTSGRGGAGGGGIVV